jgi:UDP-glucuronate 4-epimerase
MFGDGTTRRDYTYVDDLVDGIVRAIDRCTSHHLYNLGHSEPIALRDMIETIARALGKPAKIELLPEQPGDVRQTYAAIDRARLELGYQPITTFEEGIRRYVEWYRSRGDDSGQRA